MKNFKELKVWQRAMEVIENVYELTAVFPSNERFNLVSQMNRSSISIASNIAEGSSRQSNIEQKRFLEVALGSSFELETQIIAAKRIGLAEDESTHTVEAQLKEVQKMLHTLIRKLSNATKS